MKVTVTDDGQILDEDSELIGELQVEKNTLKRIEIYPDHQGNGYGKAAVQEFCEQQSKDGFDETYVACVTNPALVTILESDAVNGEEVSSHTLPISPHPMLEPQKPDYRIPL